MLTPDDVTNGSHKKVWWRCEKGHSWQAAVKSRTLGAGCPVCTGRLLVPGVNDFATIHPELAAQWHPTKNGALRPSDVMPRTQRKVWWQCSEGHVWQAAIYSRAGSQHCGCPVCAGKVKPKKRYR